MNDGDVTVDSLAEALPVRVGLLLVRPRFGAGSITLLRLREPWLPIVLEGRDLEAALLVGLAVLLASWEGTSCKIVVTVGRTNMP